MPVPTRQLADILLEERLISPADLERARDAQARAGKSLGQVLIDLGLFTEAALVAALARHLGMEFVDLAGQAVDPVAASLVPETLARRHGALPFRFADDGRLVVAMSDPSNILALDDIRTVTDREVVPVVATRADVLAAIDRHMRTGDDVEQAADELAGDEPDATELAAIGSAVEDAPIVRFVNALITRAVQDRASDIHIEPGEHVLRVRHRVDGVLHEVTSQHRRVHAGVVSRLKIMADLDIAERRVPQDGRISLKAAGRAIDLRVSTLPTVSGEKVVLRILDKSSVLLKVADLGFLDDTFARYEQSFRKPYGMILATGPTGSGKSTTLYATLNLINSPTVNVVTVEDPVEYRLAGIGQVQINPKSGLTFPVALRAILRQDPDIVLVGEMRDHQTAQIGMEAALTGHLVLSTLHTNDAPSAVTRLVEMGIDPFLVASAVDCVLAQRLARRLCLRCRQPEAATEAELAVAGVAVRPGEPAPTVYRAVGCATCAGTGYRGRLAVHEVLTVSEAVARLVVERAPTDEIARAARAEGMRSLREDGIAKVLRGDTTFEEIARVVV